MDSLLPADRSRIMASIHSKNTNPELCIRKALHALGFRFRIHCRDLPGSPDLVLPKYKAAIQVNGCFWHGHNCHIFKMPKARTEYWQQKIGKNQARDVKNTKILLESGWRLLVIWECAIQGKQKLDREVLVSLVENWILIGNEFAELEGEPRR